MKKVILFACVFVFSCQAFAQTRITVSKSGSVKSSIDLTSFMAGQDAVSRTFITTLENDLLRSGWFEKGRKGASQFVFSGSASGGGGISVAGTLTGGGQELLGKSWSESADKVRRLAHIVADEIVFAATGKRGIAATRIAMVGNMSGRKELYLCDADGGSVIQLTRDNSISLSPQWDPEGNRLLYTSYMKRYPDIYLVDLPTGNRRVVSRFPGLNTGGAYSPDGRDIALILSKDGNAELYVMNMSGGRLTRLTQTPGAAEASPTWAPDGNSIAFVSDRSGRPQIYKVSRSGGAAQRLTSRGVENVTPDWGPNNLLTFASRMGREFHVMVLDPASGQIKQISNDYGDYEDPSWAPDGRHIVVGRKSGGRSALYILDTLGDPPVALTPQQGEWFSPDWSPR